MTTMIGTAGWSIPSKNRDVFPPLGTALERYASVLNAVEINSSFYRSHRFSTWAKWAASVPEHFRFAVKVPKAITHDAGLLGADGLIEQFAAEVSHLGSKLAVVLVQLPPKLALDVSAAECFFKSLHDNIEAKIVCEPRNVSWFTDEANDLMVRLLVSRAASDPFLIPPAGVPAGWAGLSYWRLHGSPVMYRSSYDCVALGRYARQIRASADSGSPAWCIFDNTASAEALSNALSLQSEM